MSVKQNHNLIKNDTVGVCEWSHDEQTSLDKELLVLQQQGKKVNDITSILKISSGFPTKSIQQITSRIKWCQIPSHSRPSWEDYCQNENYYLQLLEQQTQQYYNSRPQTITTSKEVCLPTTSTRSDNTGNQFRRRRYSIQGETSEDVSPRIHKQRTRTNTSGDIGVQGIPQTPTQPVHKNSTSTIMIGSYNSTHSPRTYRSHSPFILSVFQSSITNTINSLNQMSQDNESILNTLENQAKNSSSQIDGNLVVQFVNNANSIITQTKTLSSSILPFYSQVIELPNELKSIVYPIIQSDIGLQYTPESIPQNIQPITQRAMSLPCSNISPMSSVSGSIHISQ
ncbi:hypothetical protein EDI_005360 [Entamoeba dispar SAW760]|uniref:Uncharacterized protein n=1 Tax=Entamoeba dispar (strain ATCC PRA-260 / SAW760) TaxID=370354 RepID=B0EA25_ENTDS|nr:uncharacterized protein EDI_005360 [Entamoeba dispar SAW760]EDR28638.1 hypothetical protein EDI_005360 [Entamoeba dispar SAW760]|eukprot:EDR28638.1 hypothetical protein EDI_005360 [Entamoeba dispar SAW760]